jgi:type II secretory pathway pseudopilin PulG
MPHLNRNPNRGSRFTFHVSRFKAFSLLEFIGVLGIIALIVAALIPAVIKRIDRAAWTKENAGLAAFSDAFIQHVLKSNNIPSELIWAQAIATELNMAKADVTNTSRRLGRALLIDNSGWLNSSSNLPLDNVGWNQGTGGTTDAPGNARFLILSSIAGSLPSSFFNIAGGGARPSSTVFNDIWGTAQGSKPTNIVWNAYAGTGEDLLIKRINLEPLFHRVVLVNGDTNLNGRGAYSINGSSRMAVPPGGSGVKVYYLDGTVLGLGTNDIGAPIGVPLMSQEVVRKDISRVFERGIWRDEIGVGLTGPNVPDFAAIAALFINTTNPPAGAPYSTWGPTPRGVAEILSAYMYGYSGWANESPCFGYHGITGNGNFPPEATLIGDALSCITKNNGGGVLVP